MLGALSMIVLATGPLLPAGSAPIEIAPGERQTITVPFDFGSAVTPANGAFTVRRVSHNQFVIVGKRPGRGSVDAIDSKNRDHSLRYSVLVADPDLMKLATEVRASAMMS